MRFLAYSRMRLKSLVGKFSLPDRLFGFSSEHYVRTMTTLSVANGVYDRSDNHNDDDYRTCSRISGLHEAERVLKVSVIGEPNSGKSTFVNSLIGAKVSAVTNIPHTTRRALYGIYTHGNTQVVLSDTPGVINFQEGRRLKMDRLQIATPRYSCEDVDLIAVVVDASNKRGRQRIHQVILDVLSEYKHVPSILLLNKIDLLRKKKFLLTIAYELLKDREKDIYGYKDTGGYSGFKHVFMVSSLSRDGIEDVRNYFIASALEAPWQYQPDIQLDSSVEEQISEIIREKILILFDHEIPWQFKQVMVLMDQNSQGVIRINKKLLWPRKSQQRYVLSKIRALHDAVHADLELLLDCKVNLTLDVGVKKNMTKMDIFSST